VLVVARLFWLVVFAIAAHFRDGLAYPALAFSLFIGWRAWRPYWLAAPILLSAAYASHVYAWATGEGKISAALGNFVFELLVFALLSAAGFGFGWLLRRRNSRSET